MNRSSATPLELRNGKRWLTRTVALGVLSSLIVLQLAAMRSANAAVSPAAQITALEAPVAEDFDSLNSITPGTAPPPGWGFIEAGTNANDAYELNDGASVTGDTYSYGTIGSADRALGTLRSGSLQSEIFAIYTNDTGETITSVTINYTCELWRLGAPDRLDRSAFFYSTDNTEYTAVDAADCVTPPSSGLSVGAIDGNVVKTPVAADISGLSIPPSAYLILNWADLDVAGFDDGLALDDFSMVAHADGGGDGDACGASEVGSQATQCTSANVLQEPGELAIAVENASVPFGDITAGQTSAAAVIGDVFYTNTLNNGQVWSSTVAATSLTSGGAVVGFDGMTFTPGDTVTPSGPVPGTSGSFTGADTTPGTTYSDPLSVVTAQASDQGNFVHSGSSATLSVPSGASAGTYAGTLQYTITG
jgi:hypothetical protein